MAGLRFYIENTISNMNCSDAAGLIEVIAYLIKIS